MQALRAGAWYATPVKRLVANLVVVASHSLTHATSNKPSSNSHTTATPPPKSQPILQFAMADAPNANDELYPIAVLIDELKVRTTNHAWLLARPPVTTSTTAITLATAAASPLHCTSLTTP